MRAIDTDLQAAVSPLRTNCSLYRQAKPNVQLSSREIDEVVAPEAADEQMLKPAAGDALEMGRWEEDLHVSRLGTRTATPQNSP